MFASFWTFIQPHAISELERTIFERHWCRARYSRTEYVRQRYNERRWDGFVAVFKLIGCPGAECCYVWKDRTPAEVKTMIVLESPSVRSPAAAVRYALSQERETSL